MSDQRQMTINGVVNLLEGSWETANDRADD